MDTKKTTGKVDCGTERIRIQYRFTEDELKQKAKDLADNCSLRQSLTDEKKQVVSEYKFKLDKVEADVNLLSNNLTTGYEMRQVDAHIQKDFDNGLKYYIVDGVIVDKQKLTASDYQLQTDL